MIAGPSQTYSYARLFQGFGFGRFGFIGGHFKKDKWSPQTLLGDKWTPNRLGGQAILKPRELLFPKPGGKVDWSMASETSQKIDGSMVSKTGQKVDGVMIPETSQKDWRGYGFRNRSKR